MARHFAIISHDQSPTTTDDGKTFVTDALYHQKAHMLGHGIKLACFKIMLKMSICKDHEACIW